MQTIFAAYIELKDNAERDWLRDSLLRGHITQLLGVRPYDAF
jgi:hypothetical protein